MTAPLRPHDRARPHRRVAIVTLRQPREPRRVRYALRLVTLWFLWTMARVLFAALDGRFPA